MGNVARPQRQGLVHVVSMQGRAKRWQGHATQLCLRTGTSPHIASQIAWRPNHQVGLRVTQVTGVGDHISLRVRCRARQGTKCEGRMKCARGCMGVHGGAWGSCIVILEKHACLDLSSSRAWTSLGDAWGADGGPTTNGARPYFK